MDPEKAKVIIDHFRSTLPEELTEAQEILSHAESIIARALTEAKRIRGAAAEEMRSQVTQNSIVEEAQSRAGDIIARGQKEAGASRVDADEYSLSVLRDLDRHIQEVSKQVTRGMLLIQANLERVVENPQDPANSPKS